MTTQQLKENKLNISTYPNLYFHDPTHLVESLLFAIKNKPAIEENHSIENCLESLNHMAHNNESIIILFPDFVKHSFYWQMYNKEGKFDMNGGIILHGYQETYSIEINAPNKPHWSIHT